jgi:putative transposase
MNSSEVALQSVGNQGVIKNYIRYNSPELQDVRRSLGLRFRTEVKFNPKDISHVWVRLPRTAKWLRVPSCYPEYADGLSEVQRKVIRFGCKAGSDNQGRASSSTRGVRDL